MKGRILVADNDPNYRKALITALSLEGYEVFGASNPLEAEEIIKKERIHLAIFDKRLSNDNDADDESGIELVQMIKERYPKMIVITFTAYMSIDTLIKARRAGAFDYLVKSSLNFEALTKEITEALEGKYPFSETFEIEVEDSIYEKYGQTLEKDHKDEFVAINFDGDYILGKDEIEVIEEAVKKFGKGSFILRKIGYDYVYKI